MTLTESIALFPLSYAPCMLVFQHSFMSSAESKTVIQIVVLYLTPRRNHPLEPIVFGTSSQYTGLLGFWLVISAAHTFWYDLQIGRAGAFAVDFPFLHASPTGLGTLWHREIFI